MKRIIALLLAVLMLAAFAPAVFAEENETTAIKDAKVGDVVVFGKYEQDNDKSNGSEDIEWIVLAEEDDRILVLSRCGIQGSLYNLHLDGITWAESSLRWWLNGRFMEKAFTAEEMEQIVSVTVENHRNPRSLIGSAKDTEEKVFLLSIDEVNEYLPDDADRACTVTANARRQGAYAAHNGNCWWWLRSSGRDAWYAAIVNTDGSVNLDGSKIIDQAGAVRPAMWISR